VPLTIVDHYGIEPQILLLGTKRVQVVTEVEVTILDLQNSILSIVLIAHAEKFSVLLPRAESQLDLSAKPIGFEAQGVLHITLGLEGGGYGGNITGRTRPTRSTTIGTDATISESGLEIDASGTVHAGHIEALVAIHTALGIGRHNASFAATVSIRVSITIRLTLISWVVGINDNINWATENANIEWMFQLSDG